MSLLIICEESEVAQRVADGLPVPDVEDVEVGVRRRDGAIQTPADPSLGRATPRGPFNSSL